MLRKTKQRGLHCPETVRLQFAIGVGKDQNRPNRRLNSQISRPRDSSVGLTQDGEREASVPGPDGFRSSLRTAIINNDHFKGRGVLLSAECFEAALERPPIVVHRDDDAEIGHRRRVWLLIVQCSHRALTMPQCTIAPAGRKSDSRPILRGFQEGRGTVSLTTRSALLE